MALCLVGAGTDRYGIGLPVEPRRGRFLWSQATATIAIRSREGEDLGVLSVEQTVELLSQQVQAPDHAARAAAQQNLYARLKKEARTGSALQEVTQ